MTEQEPKSAEQEASKPLPTVFEATIDLAKRGDKRVLSRLRKILAENPEIWQHYGNLPNIVQQNWLNLIAGEDLLFSESVRRELDTIREELAGPSPTPLERILVDRILASQVRVSYFEMTEPLNMNSENVCVGRYRMQRHSQAQRDLLSAIKALADVRSLIARTNVSQTKPLDPPTIHSPAAPLVPNANGEMPSISSRSKNGKKSRLNARATKAVKEADGINVHNRLTGILEPVGAGAVD